MGMPGVIGRCVALAVTAVVVWPAAAQGQKVLHGETSLGRPVNLTLGDDGRPAKLTFAWRVPCSGGGPPGARAGGGALQRRGHAARRDRGEALARRCDDGTFPLPRVVPDPPARRVPDPGGTP